MALSLIPATGLSQIDPYTAVAVAANLVLVLLGVVVSIFETWTKKNRTGFLIGFIATGLIGAVTNCGRNEVC